MRGVVAAGQIIALRQPLEELVVLVVEALAVTA
jgi:hypothetical protein